MKSDFTSTVTMPSACAGSRLCGKSSNMAALQLPALAKFEEALERLRLGLGHVATGRDVVNAVELVQHAQLRGHPLGMARRTVGEYELPALQPRDGFAPAPARAEPATGRCRARSP